ncbi:MAG: hypothetical protein HQK76_10520 [Desulfobacterales bacterium]|nr:hypothetical protein [Desulfobacterales bacterium]
MMINMENSAISDKNKQGISSLFDELELKHFFKKYLILIGSIEIAILIIAWFYQLGDTDYDRFGPVDTPFPWKIYFLVAFLVPIAITFVLGIVIIGFNKFFYDKHHTEEKTISGDSKEAKPEKRFDSFLKSVLKIPFLVGLLILGLSIGVIYRIEDIIVLIGQVGEKTARFLIITISIVASAGFIFMVLRMLLNYKIRTKSMEYEYKSHVAEKLGLVILDQKTVIDKNGNIISEGVKALPKSVPRIALPLNTTELEDKNKDSNV